MLPISNSIYKQKIELFYCNLLKCESPVIAWDEYSWVQLAVCECNSSVGWMSQIWPRLVGAINAITVLVGLENCELSRRRDGVATLELPILLMPFHLHGGEGSNLSPWANLKIHPDLSWYGGFGPPGMDKLISITCQWFSAHYWSVGQSIYYLRHHPQGEQTAEPNHLKRLETLAVEIRSRLMCTSRSTRHSNRQSKPWCWTVEIRRIV